MAEFFARPEYSQYQNLQTLYRVQFTGTNGYGVTDRSAQTAQQAWSALEKTWKNNARAIRPANVFQGNLGRNLFQLRTLLSIGPTLVMVATSILLSIAIESVIAQANARPKLLAAKTAAAQPVNLGAMVSDPAGDDMAFVFWTKAMEGPAYADPSLVTLASAANKLEAARGYAKLQQ